jgi:hypothetical protein
VRVQNPIPAIDTRLRHVLEIENENLVQLKTA